MTGVDVFLRCDALCKGLLAQSDQEIFVRNLGGESKARDSKVDLEDCPPDYLVWVVPKTGYDTRTAPKSLKTQCPVTFVVDDDEEEDVSQKLRE